jgi:hypothetical protein
MILVYYSEGTGNHAVAAAVADVWLHIYRSELGANDRARGTRFQTSRVPAVFTNVREKQPAKWIFCSGDLGSQRCGLFQEHDVPPGRVAETVGVVVGLAGEVEAVGRNVIPFFASNFTGLASYA